MGLQLIFVVETNKKCDSDWMYIKDTVMHFYCVDQQIKLNKVYMDGKGNYKSKEKEISKLKSQYAATSRKNSTKVLYCFDCDDYDVKQEDAEFLSRVHQYCQEQGYEFVWFCKDIERVYLKRKVDDSQKKKEAELFKSKKLIQNVDKRRLEVINYKADSSNILNVLDQHLVRK